ncbi:MAG: GDP-D-mannose 3, 5-epimerase [Acidimicrobiaceae bacterium]|nr:GDP-D-mannose 3, 5-epimerase [Acidimicrobiaceae bacterium]
MVDELKPEDPEPKVDLGTVLVAGGGGFIGGHLVKDLVSRGVAVRAVDSKPVDEWYQVFPEADNRQGDLQRADVCAEMVSGMTTVFNLAADMGGMGFIENNKAACMLSVLISTHLLQAAPKAGVQRYFYASSACVYPLGRQDTPDVEALRESDAYPADPEDGYGWEKLFSERMARHFLEDFALATRVARYHNIYGPNGTYQGGREKAPAAICRKVIEAKLSGRDTIEIWGDGQQTRSFTYIDDCLTGTLKVTLGDSAEPVNVGSDEMVTINRLVDIVEELAGVHLQRKYILDAPLGVRGRNSDNSLIQKLYNWAPAVSLEAGMEQTYRWIYDQMAGH